jgi:hypothetical protein
MPLKNKGAQAPEEEQAHEQGGDYLAQDKENPGQQSLPEAGSEKGPSDQQHQEKTDQKTRQGADRYQKEGEQASHDPNDGRAGKGHHDGPAQSRSLDTRQTGPQPHENAGDENRENQQKKKAASQRGNSLSMPEHGHASID